MADSGKGGGGLLGFLGGPLGGLLGSAVGGLFGGSHAERQTAAQRAALAQQQAIARQLYQFSQSAPMTSPDELGALAQDRGLLGGQQRSELAGLYAGQNPGMQGQMGQADMMGSLASRLMGQQMQMNEQHMLDALGRRRESLLQAANVNQSAAEMAPRQAPSALPAAMSQLMQTLAYQNAMKKGQASAGTAGQGHPPGVPLQMPGFTPSIGMPHQAPPSFFPPGQGQVALPPPPGGGLQMPAAMTQTGQFPGDDPTLTAILQALVGHLASRKKGARPRKPKAAVGDPPGSTLGAMMGMGGGQGGPPPGQQGAAAPGNAPQDVNGVANQTRQANLSTRLMRLPNGMVVPY